MGNVVLITKENLGTSRSVTLRAKNKLWDDRRLTLGLSARQVAQSAIKRDVIKYTQCGKGCYLRAENKLWNDWRLSARQVEPKLLDEMNLATSGKVPACQDSSLR